MANIKAVAERAGVSPATVSRVLAGSTRVNPEYRQRVLDAAAELDFRPNRLARNLRRQTTETIGVVVSDIENPHFTRMVRIVEEAAFGRGFRVLLSNTDETAEKQRLYLDLLASERVRGVVLVPIDPAAPEISRLLDLGIPVVAFDRVAADPRADAVIVDNAECSRRATEHLIQLGHRRIGFIGGRHDIQTGAERTAGYAAAMTAAGLTPHDVDGDFRLEQGRQATDQLLAADSDLTALVVANNLMTVGALQAINDRGLRVPDDLAVVGMDDPFWASLIRPPLTTMVQPVHRMADAAVRLLFERIDDTREQARSVVFDCELRVRASCGAASVR